MLIFLEKYYKMMQVLFKKYYETGALDIRDLLVFKAPVSW